MESERRAPSMAVGWPQRDAFPGLLMYCTIVFGASWVLWVPLVLAQRGVFQLPVASSLLVFAGGFVPSLTAFALTARRAGSAGVRALLWRALRWRVNPAWYAVAILAPFALMVAAIGLHIALGGRPPAFPAPTLWPFVLLNYAAVIVLGGALGEEFGWRGYALPLLQARLGALVAGIAVGAVWGLWHLPLFLVGGTPQHSLPFGIYLVQAVALSVVFAWVYNASGGSLFVVLLLHASLDAFPQPLRLLPEATGSVGPFVIATALVCAWAVAIALATDPRTLSRRRRTPSNGAHP